METVSTENGVMDIFENDIEFFLDDFCQKNHIEDMRKESQNIWNAALLYIQKNVFKPNRGLLKAGNYIINNNLVNNASSNCNAYDIEKVLYITDYYINLCYQYEKEVSILGFEKFSGIPDKTVFEWAKHGTNRSSPSTPSSEIYKKLSKEREESLSNMALSGKRNPVGVIAVLNNKCGWADQKQVIKEERITIAPVSREAIAAEFGALLEEKPQDVVFDDIPKI